MHSSPGQLTEESLQLQTEVGDEKNNRIKRRSFMVIVAAMSVFGFKNKKLSASPRERIGEEVFPALAEGTEKKFDVIVDFKEEVTEEKVKKILDALDLRIIKLKVVSRKRNMYQIIVESHDQKVDMETVLKKLRGSSDIEDAEPNGEWNID